MNNQDIYNCINRNFEKLFGSRSDKTELEQRLKSATESNARDAALKKGRQIAKDLVLKTSRQVYTPFTDVDKVESALDGLEILLVQDPASKKLAEAYWFLHQYFPTNEIDPQNVWEEFMAKTEKGFVFENPRGEKVYTKYVCVAVVDKEGKFGKKGEVIAAFDGTFEANKKVNTLYGSHLAILPSARRFGIGTAVLNAALVECNKYARQAEKMLGTTYNTNKTGLKVDAFTGEIEFASLADEDSVKATVGRHVFHGRNGVSVCETRQRRKNGAHGGVRYAQSDTTYDQESKFDPKIWTSVPLYFGIRNLNGEASMPTEKVKSLIDLMYDGFLVAGMNLEGVTADRNYAQKRMTMKDVTLHLLPKNAQEAAEFVKDQGEAYKILTTVYAGHNFTLQNAESMKPTIELERIPEILTK